jgi:hypothetical protein
LVIYAVGELGRRICAGMTWIRRRLGVRLAPALVFLALGNFCGLAQDARVSCSSGLKIALSADYAAPWVSGRASRVKVQYGLSSPESGSAAWIEVWDGRNRLFKQNVKVQAQGELIWGGLLQVPDTPSNLQLAIFDPQLPLLCGDDCSTKGGTLSIVLAGTAPDEDAPFPSLTWGSSRFGEGDEGIEPVLEGRLLGSQTTVLLQEQDAGGLWLAREYLPIDLVDLNHLRVHVPAGYLSRPTVLGLTAERSGSETPPGNEVGPPVQTLYITSKDSPVFSSVEPSEVSADEAEKGTVTVRLHGSGFRPSSRVTLSLENARDLDQGGLKPEFISANELRIDLPAQHFVIDNKWSAIRPIHLWVANDDVLHISEAQEVRVSPSEHFPAYPSQAPVAVITQISPYPVPLMESGDLSSTPLIVQGTNFRLGESVVAVNDRGEAVKLKTLYVSSQELRAWLPSRVWCEHRLRYRLIVQTSSGLCVAEVVEDDWHP